MDSKFQVGDKVVCHIEGVVTEIRGERAYAVVVTTTGETWSIELDDPDWAVVTVS